ncbi:MAG: efflux RND transporter periplasmic adaptor subunit [Phycisphaeraceae bacterium]
MLPLMTRGIIGLLVLAATVGMYVLLVMMKPEVEGADPDSTRMQLSVYPVREVAVRRQWMGYGTARAKRSADVPARIAAVVTERPAGIEAGSRVTEGQTLVRLDASDYEQELRAARETLRDIQAQLDQIEVEKKRLQERVEIEQRDLEIAQRETQRIAELFESGAANRQDVDAREREVLAARRALVQSQEALERIPSRRASLEARLASQRAAIETAQIALGRTDIISPIAGELQSVDVEVGESVSPGQRVARVVDPTVIEVPLKLPASAGDSVTLGNAVELSEPGEGGAAWSSEVVRIAPEQDPQQRTITVYVEVEQPRDATNAMPRLMPGTFLRGEVANANETPQWVVPRRSVRRGRVFLLEQGTVRSRAIEAAYEVAKELPSTGLPDNLWLVVRNGEEVFTRGDMLVLSASSQLADGQRADAERVGAALEQSQASRSAEATPPREEATP